MAEFEASSSAGLSPGPSAVTRTRTYTVGLDLSQSKQGAGGVGGLCAITDETGAEDLSYHYASDGNGNIVGLYDDSFTAVAEYEYSPFGELIGQNGPYAEENPYRFSTKYQNEYLGGLHYYGYRYYDASTGRWPSRDPIGEEGGLNLYGFLENDGVNRCDVLGKAAFPLLVLGNRAIGEDVAYATNGDFLARRISDAQKNYSVFLNEIKNMSDYDYRKKYCTVNIVQIDGKVKSLSTKVLTRDVMMYYLEAELKSKVYTVVSGGMDKVEARWQAMRNDASYFYPYNTFGFAGHARGNAGIIEFSNGDLGRPSFVDEIDCVNASCFSNDKGKQENLGVSRGYVRTENQVIVFFPLYLAEVLRD